MRIRSKKLKSFTLIETVVTILIYAILLLMITNIVLANARMSQQLRIRSRIRSELTEIVTLVKRDIRNVSSIDVTSDPTNCTNRSINSQCKLNILGTQVIWSYDRSTQKIIRRTIPTDGSTYNNSDILVIKSLVFDIIPDDDKLSKRATIIITITAEGKNSLWNVKNQIIQETISTRNYDLSL